MHRQLYHLLLQHNRGLRITYIASCIKRDVLRQTCKWTQASIWIKLTQINFNKYLQILKCIIKHHDNQSSTNLIPNTHINNSSLLPRCRWVRSTLCSIKRYICLSRVTAWLMTASYRRENELILVSKSFTSIGLWSLTLQTHKSMTCASKCIIQVFILCLVLYHFLGIYTHRVLNCNLRSSCLTNVHIIW